MKLLVAAFFALTVLIAVDASCAVYMWEDDQGITSFTEDYGNIPKKYRNKAKQIGQDPAEDVDATAVEEPQLTKPVKPQVEPEGGNAPKPADNADKKKFFGGKDESYWYNEFGKLKADLRSYKEQLAAINARLANTDKMARSEYKSLENTRKLLEEQEGAARKRLQTLIEEANRAGVPSDLR
ncbi:hypothetical protein OR1_02927 [Geobacter sp. OR-1]|uniref:DUF4124 domain-containing protein n=1 Tax=Geobacter sp. OR-1 TaxID=1266765 RepID=UPI000543B843|nr:DUF4124 domain-containing protein [Geobacter sp. OR-1]GAM10638.1 hypothetical protein OR1_02927 [Geobacter sp. OR-1]